MKKLLIPIFILLISVGMVYSKRITVTSPNGGENWEKNSSHPVTWTLRGVTGNVIIQLMQGGSSQGAIYNGANTGTFNWTIDKYLNNNQIAAGSYKLQVKSLTDPSILDQSDDDFTIKNVIRSVQSTMPRVETKLNLEPRPYLKLQNDMDGWMPGKCNYWKFAVDIKNFGNAAAQNVPFRFEINGPAGTAFDNFVRNGTLSSCLTIAPDATCKFARTYQINAPGMYYYTFKIDPNNNLNLYKKVSGRFVQQRPDLIVFISHYLAARLAIKKFVTFYVKNQGVACSKPSVLNTYMKKKGHKTYNIPSLRPGDIYKITRSVRWFTLGTKSITARADQTNLVGEINENNNTYETSLKVLTAFAFDPSGLSQPPAGFFENGRIINK